MLRCVPVPCGPVAWTAPERGFTSRLGSPYTWIGSTIRGTPKLGRLEGRAELGCARDEATTAVTARAEARRGVRRTTGLSQGAGGGPGRVLPPSPRAVRILPRGT